MPRPGITKLDKPPLAYRPDLIMDGFETAKAMREEDLLRAALLEKTIHSGRFGNSARELAHRLREGSSKAPAQTCASALYMRDQRIRVIGHLHQLIDQTDPESVSIFSIVKMGWACHAGDFHEADARKLKASFRADLSRSGAPDADGWLFGALDCQFDSTTKNFQFHMHGVAADGIIDVIDRLRKRDGYRRWKDVPGIPDCKKPIVRSQEPLDKMPRPLAYQLKHFWKMKVGGRTRRLPDDEHTRALLFLDQYRLEELTLLMKLHVKNGALYVS